MTFIHNIDPILFSLGPLHVRYYGLNYALTFFIAYFLLNYLIKNKKGIDFSKDDVLDLVMYSFIGVIVGARLFYVVAYNFSFYIEHPLRIFATWTGGMSYHGGLIGGIIGGYIYCKRKKISVLKITDLILIPVSLGMFFGRITNFINGELVGRITNVSWAVNFANERLVDGTLVFRHPSQIYQAIANLTIFGVLFLLYKRSLPIGFLTSLYVTLYGAFRFITEFFRMPDPQIGYIFGLTLGQIFCAIMVIVGISFMYYFWKKNKK